jgi:DNA helicase MCM8
MLQAAANIVPRGVYVCGNTTTTSGLTVTLSKDGASGDYALEAGALVLGDMGCCCIDEFDKMGSQHQALLEAMEQQSISIAKAGIVCSLPARTSILAAANPAGGHYNKAKTVAENLKMGSALLSRFDLVFILLDKPDEEMDMMLSEHVMALHAGKRRCEVTWFNLANYSSLVTFERVDVLVVLWVEEWSLLWIWLMMMGERSGRKTNHCQRD